MANSLSDNVDPPEAPEPHRSPREPRSLLRRAFVTEDRRPALFWRLAIYLFIVLFPLAISEIALKKLGETESANRFLSSLAAAVVGIGGVLGVTWLCRTRVDRRPWSGMALPSLRQGWPLAILGLALGCGMMALGFGVQYAAGWVRVTGLEVATAGLSSVAVLLAAGMVTYLKVGFAEELMARGYLFQNLGEGRPIWLATVIVGLVFGLLHANAGGFSLTFVLSAVVITAFLVVSRLVTGSLWFAVGWHAGWDWTQDPLLGLAAPNAPFAGRSLFHLEQSGPEAIVGAAPSIESGILFIGIEALGVVLLLFWAQWRSRPIRWRAALSDEGILLLPEQGSSAHQEEAGPGGSPDPHPLDRGSAS